MKLTQNQIEQGKQAIYDAALDGRLIAGRSFIGTRDGDPCGCAGLHAALAIAGRTDALKFLSDVTGHNSDAVLGANDRPYNNAMKTIRLDGSNTQLGYRLVSPRRALKVMDAFERATQAVAR